MARRWPWLLILLAPLLPLWRAVFLGEGIGPFDQIQAMAPWNKPAPARPWDVLQADGVIQFYPWRDLVLSSWGKLEPPFWNPYQLAGTPLLANSQSGAFYPPHLLLGILHVPTLFAMALLAWFHLALAGCGAAMLAKKLGASNVGQALAGLSFGLSPFLLAWTALASVPTTVAWIPWALVAAHGAVRGDRKSLLALPAALAMMIFAGHLQFVAYGFFAVGLYALIEAIRLRAWVNFGMTMAALVVSFALAAIHLAPVLDYSQYSHRRNTPSETGYGDYVAGAIQPYELVGVVFPDLVGNPNKYAIAQQGISAYWPAFAKRGGNYAEGAIGLGPIVVFALCLLRRRQLGEGIGLAILGGLAFLLAMGTPLNRLLYFLIPGWSSSGSPGRIAVLFVMAACVLAGTVFQENEKEQSEDKLDLPRVLPFSILALAPIFYIVSKPALTSWLPGAPSDFVSRVIAATLPETAGSGLILAMLTYIFFSLRKRHKQEAFVLAPVAVLICYLTRILITAPADLKIDGPKTERIAVLGNSWNLLGLPQGVLPPNTASISRIHDLAGYDSLLHRDTVGLLKDIDGEDPAPPENGNMMLIKRHPDQAKLADAGVTEVWSKEGNGQLKGPGRADVDGQPAEITDETLTSLTVKAKGPGKLTLRDRNLPGWKATVDGNPAEITGSTWREVNLESGDHTVVFRYSPPGFRLGLLVSGVAWIIWAVATILSFRRKPE